MPEPFFANFSQMPSTDAWFASSHSSNPSGDSNQRAGWESSNYPWISQPSAARAASITASANAGCGWIVRASSG